MVTERARVALRTARRHGSYGRSVPSGLRHSPPGHPLALLVEALVAYGERVRAGFVPGNLQDAARRGIIHTANLYH
jgi:hypothetical protein